jgi:hypothetical protein
VLDKATPGANAMILDFLISDTLDGGYANDDPESHAVVRSGSWFALAET